MLCELASYNRMIESAGRQTWFDVICNSDDFLWHSVEPEESGPRDLGRSDINMLVVVSKKYPLV